MRVRGLLVAGMLLGATALSAAPASAQYNWSGLYFGGHSGWAGANTDWAYRSINPFSAPGPGGPITLLGDDFGGSGRAVGIQLGWMTQTGQMVWGLEGSFSHHNILDRHASPGQFLLGTLQSVENEVRWTGALTGRLGYAFAPSWLGYVKGGYAFGRISTFGRTSPDNPGFNFGTSELHHGWTLGTGLEWHITKDATVAIEYDFTRLNAAQHVGQVTGAPDFPVVHDVAADVHAITTRLNIHLHRPVAAASDAPVK